MMFDMVMKIFLVGVFCVWFGVLVVPLINMLWDWIKHIRKLNK